MGSKTRLCLALALVVIAGTAWASSGASASKAPVRQYVLANSHAKCRAHYVKRTLTIKEHGRTVRVAGCVYRAPAPTNTTTTTTTTTEPKTVTTTTLGEIPFQATSTIYDTVNSGSTGNGSTDYATEYAFVAIGDISTIGIVYTAPGAGTVKFTDANGVVLCSSDVTVAGVTPAYSASCSSGPLTRAPVNPITATYSGTSLGWNDGHGTSYAGSSGSGSPFEAPITTPTTLP